MFNEVTSLGLQNTLPWHQLKGIFFRLSDSLFSIFMLPKYAFLPIYKKDQLKRFRDPSRNRRGLFRISIRTVFSLLQVLQRGDSTTPKNQETELFFFPVSFNPL